MSPTSTFFNQPHDLQPHGLEGWLERWGGVVVAVAIHLALIAVFSNQYIHIQKIIQPKKNLVVTFKLPAAMALPPVSPPPEVSPPAIAPAVATTSDPTAIESQEIQRRTYSADSPDSTDPGDAPRETLLTLEASETGQAILPPEFEKQVREEIRKLQSQKVRQQVEQAQIRMEVNKLEVEAKGRKFTLDSDGGRQGAIRTLDVAGMPDAVVYRVFDKYHIRIERRVTSSNSNSSFLNAAVTGEGTFRSTPASGLQDVFILSPTAIAMMSRLEVEGLQRRGYDPRKTRIREIKFGIIKNELGEWDLGVTNLVTEKIE